MNYSLPNGGISSDIKDNDVTLMDVKINENYIHSAQPNVTESDCSFMYLMHPQQLQQRLQPHQQMKDLIENSSVTIMSPTSFPGVVSKCQLVTYPSVSSETSSDENGTPSCSSYGSLVSHKSLFVLPSIIAWPATLINQGYSENELQQQDISYPHVVKCMASDSSTCAERITNNSMPIIQSSCPMYTCSADNKIPQIREQHCPSPAERALEAVVHLEPELNLPKKPLTPYMKYSKSIWQQMKCANPSMSVCEAGASIGRLWREMSEIKKQKYNETFSQEKAQYEAALQSYLKLTGLRLCDVIKLKLHKKDPRNKSPLVSEHVDLDSSSHVSQLVTNCVRDECSTVSESISLVSIDSSLVISSASSSKTHILPNISQMWNAHSSVQSNEREASLNENDKGTLAVSTKEIVLQTELSSCQPLCMKGSKDDLSISTPMFTSCQDLSNLVTFHRAYKQISNFDQVTTEKSFLDVATIDDELESGEIVVDRPRLAAHFIKIMRTYSSHSGGIDSVLPEAASAHKMYNSYSFDPWIQYKADEKNCASFIYNRDQMLKIELEHLRLSLSDKSNEVKRLCWELKQAYKVIDKLKQQAEETHLLAE